MTTTARFPDWWSLSARDRPAAAERCRESLARVGRSLHAVASEFDSVFIGGGPLGGLPYVAKDMIATGKVVPSWGCAEPLLSEAPPAAVIDCLDKAGACLIGTAEMTELAYEPSGINAGRSNVLNPWNFEFAPGGSSSGSAALVAAGCCYAALGSDTGGSVRIPAHCCGVTGLKPTWGRVPVEGTMPLAPSLDTIGLLARSAADLAMVWSAISGATAPAAADALSGVILEDAFSASDPEIAQICRTAIDVLGRLGLCVVTRAGFPEEADRQALLVMQAEAARVHGARMDDERVDATLRKRLRKGHAIGNDELAASLAARRALRAEFLASQFGDADVVFLPVMPIKTPCIAEVSPTSPDFRAGTLYALSRFTRFVNFLGLPALAVPAGFDTRGMPVGLQIVGRPDSDALLLAVAKKLQAEADWHGRVPTAIASDIVAKKD